MAVRVVGVLVAEGVLPEVDVASSTWAERLAEACGTSHLSKSGCSYPEGAQTAPYVSQTTVFHCLQPHIIRRKSCIIQFKKPPIIIKLSSLTVPPSPPFRCPGSPVFAVALELSPVLAVCVFLLLQLQVEQHP